MTPRDSNTRKLNLVISSVAGLFVVGILFYRLQTDLRPPQNSSLTVDLAGLMIEVSDQPTSRRSLIDANVLVQDNASERASSEVFQPYIIRAVPKTGFAVFDFGDKRIKVFDYSGTLIGRLGGGQGEGPGEFLGATDMLVDGTSVHVLDAKQSRITTFDIESEKVESITIRGSLLYRMASSLPNQYLGFRLHGESMLGWVEGDGRVSTIPNIVPIENPRDWILLDGDLHWTGDSFILSPRFFPVFIHLDKDARFQKATPTMEYHGYEATTVEYFGQSVTTRNNVPLRISTSVADKTLFSLTTVTDSTESSSPLTRLVDLYDTVDGAYKSSIAIPNECERIAVDAEWLFCSTGAEIRIMKTDIQGRAN